MPGFFAVAAELAPVSQHCLSGSANRNSCKLKPKAL